MGFSNLILSRDILSRNIGSSLLNHINESGDPDCSFHFEDIKILESGRYDQDIRFIESILLKYDKQNLNTCERSIQLRDPLG